MYGTHYLIITFMISTITFRFMCIYIYIQICRYVYVCVCICIYRPNYKQWVSNTFIFIYI
jgi:hypothetical protein